MLQSILFLRLSLGFLMFYSVAIIFVNNTKIGQELYFSQMKAARLIHYAIGWLDSPIYGVGINSHLSYMSVNISFSELGLRNDGTNFFLNNSLHNSHVIIITETGLIGAIFWLLGFYITISKRFKLLASNYFLKK